MNKDLMIDELFGNGEELTEKQKRIILAAIDAFSQKGYSATSTSEIAKKAGVAEGTIFRHYKTKKELLFSIVNPIMDKLVAPFVMKDLNKVLDQQFDHLEDFLHAMIENQRDFLLKNLPLLKILIQEIPFHQELKEVFKDHIALKVFQKLSVTIEFFQTKGEINSEIPPGTAIRLLFSSVAGYLMFRHVFLPESDWNDQLETEKTVQFISRGLAPY